MKKNIAKFNTFFVLLFINAALMAQPLQLETNDVLPADFAEIQVTVMDAPSEDGYVFLSQFGNWGYYEGATPYAVVADNYGTPVFYQKFPGQVHDFKIQPNGLISYFDLLDIKHHLMDWSFQEVGTVAVKYVVTDFHDFQILENGNYLLLGDEYRLVDMDTVVEGGQPGVTVMGAIIQLQNPDQEVIFQWSSWDHFQITDAMDYVDLTTAGFIDYVHANALEMDTDSTVLMSCREMGEITKININTGEIVWRLGGENNQFTWLGNDTIGFSMQHDIRKLSNGHFQIFDNGVFHDPIFTNVVQLSLDEENKTAEVIRRISSQPEGIVGFIMGNAQELPNGNTMVGWGSGTPNITEFKPDGTKALEFTYEAVSYRAFRFPFETTAFSLSTNSLDFGQVLFSDSVNREIVVTNNLTETIEINRIVSHTEKYLFSEAVPLVINPGEESTLSIKFRPDNTGTFDDVLTLCYDVNTEELTRRIAKQITVTGQAFDDSSIGENLVELVQVFPNPASNILNINFKDAGERFVEIMDYTGKKMNSFRTQEQKLTIDFSMFPNGIYLIKAQNENGKIGITKVVKE